MANGNRNGIMANAISKSEQTIELLVKRVGTVLTLSPAGLQASTIVRANAMTFIRIVWRGDTNMPARSKPLERIKATARNPTHKADGRELVPAPYTIIKRVDAPKMPVGLKRHGKTEWTKVWASGPWLNPEQDYPWVEMIARAYDDIDTFRSRVNEDGLIVKGYAGQTVAHPLIAEIRKCEDTIRKCLSVLGYSPTDRARLGLAEVKRQTALQEFITKSDANKRQP